MSERVTRDGDTVTVQCREVSADFCEITPSSSDERYMVTVVEVSEGHEARIVADRTDLAALAHHLLALAGEPDWKSLAVKFGRIERIRQRRMKWFQDHPEADFLPAYLDRALEEAKAAITDAEWAALEGVGDESRN